MVRAAANAAPVVPRAGDRFDAPELDGVKMTGSFDHFSKSDWFQKDAVRRLGHMADLEGFFVAPVIMVYTLDEWLERGHNIPRLLCRMPRRQSRAHLPHRHGSPIAWLSQAVVRPATGQKPHAYPLVFYIDVSLFP
jgi:hypothetical protein